MLENAYFIYRVPRYELKGKQLLKTQGKYYFIDNGLKNIIAHLGHDSFHRIKMGVGEKPKGFDLADYVLGNFSSGDEAILADAIKKACDAIECMVTEDCDAAMNKFNG